MSRDLRQRAGQLDAGRSAADDHERQQPSLSRPVLLALRLLEREENPTSYIERVLQRLQSGRVRPPLVVAEIRVAGARCHNQVVVRHLAIAEDDSFVIRIDCRRLREPHLDVRLMTEDPADRRRDVAGRQPGRRDLIEERLKDVVVAPVDEQNIDRRVTKCFCGVEPAETAADDDDARTRGCRHSSQIT